MSWTEDSCRFCSLAGTHLGDVVLVTCVKQFKCTAWLQSVVSSLFVGSFFFFFASWHGFGANRPINFNGFLSVDHWYSFLSVICQSFAHYVWSSHSVEDFTSLSFGAWRRIVYFVGDFYEGFVFVWYRSVQLFLLYIVYLYSKRRFRSFVKVDSEITPKHRYRCGWLRGIRTQNIVILTL